MEFFYNFNSGKVVNPLDKITHFFVNPYQIGSWIMLGLDKKVDDCDVVIQESTGLPIIILPISLLNLEDVHIKMENNGNMLITNKLGRLTQKIYAKPTEQRHIVRIDTVLNSDNCRTSFEKLAAF